MAQPALLSLADYKAKVGADVGVSDWLLVSQDRINQFADVTNDHQFIHIDIERAKDTPFGGTIAHGLLTLSLLPAMSYQAIPRIEGTKIAINYGYNKIRFIAPVKSGKQLRGHFKLAEVSEAKPGQVMSIFTVSVEIEDEVKPALIAEWVALAYI